MMTARTVDTSVVVKCQKGYQAVAPGWLPGVPFDNPIQLLAAEKKGKSGRKMKLSFRLAESGDYVAQLLCVRSTVR